MYINNSLKDVPVEHKAKILFDYDTKIKMMDSLGVSYYSFNNCLSKFRKVELLSSNNELHKSLSVEPKDGYEVTYKFKVNES